MFWATFLVVIAGFYLSFAACFAASHDAWLSEIVGVGFSRLVPWAGYSSRLRSRSVVRCHGLWGLSHSASGSSLAGRSLTQIPFDYGIFCSTYDLVVVCHLMMNSREWREPGRFDH